MGTERVYSMCSQLPTMKPRAPDSHLMGSYKQAEKMCGAYMRNNVSAHKIESRLGDAFSRLKSGEVNVSRRGGKRRASTRSRRASKRSRRTTRRR